MPSASSSSSALVRSSRSAGPVAGGVLGQGAPTLGDELAATLGVGDALLGLLGTGVGVLGEPVGALTGFLSGLLGCRGGVVGEPTRVDHLGPRPGHGLLGLLTSAVGATGGLLDLAARLVLGGGHVLVGVLLGPLPLGGDVVVGLALGLGDHLLDVLVGLLTSATYLVLTGLLGGVDLLGRGPGLGSLLGGLGLELLGPLERGVGSTEPGLHAVPERRGVRDGDGGVARRLGQGLLHDSGHGGRQLPRVRGEPADRMRLLHGLPSPEVCCACDARHIHRKQGRG